MAAATLDAIQSGQRPVVPVPSVYRRYVLIAMGTLATVLLVLACAKCAAIATVQIRQPERIYNLRRLPPALRLPVLEGYVRWAFGKAEGPVLVGLGDSQTFGFRLGVQHTALAWLADFIAGLDVRNLAMINGQAADATRALEAVTAQGVKPAFATYNVNLTRQAKTERILVDPDPLDLLRAINDVRLTSLLGLVDGDDDDSKGSARITVADPSLRDIIWAGPERAQFQALLRALQAGVRHPLVYVAPYPVAAMQASGIDVAAVRREASSYTEACNAVIAVQGRCLNLFDAVPDEGFFDISHLNNRGMELLASILADHVRQIAAADTAKGLR